MEHKWVASENKRVKAPDWHPANQEAYMKTILCILALLVLSASAALSQPYYGGYGYGGYGSGGYYGAYGYPGYCGGYPFGHGGYPFSYGGGPRPPAAGNYGAYSYGGYPFG